MPAAYIDWRFSFSSLTPSSDGLTQFLPTLGWHAAFPAPTERSPRARDLWMGRQTENSGSHWIMNQVTMMADIFSSTVSDRICAHMNDDHADAVLLYAQAFAGATAATAATLLNIDPQGMELRVQEGEEVRSVRIAFDHVLQDAEDAHHTLIDMVKQARGRVQA